jgi:hypothetical protein
VKAYAGPQFVGIDSHRRRSVIVRMTAAGEVLKTSRIVNDVDRLAAVLRRAGSLRRWCWRPPTAGTGPPTCWLPGTRTCIWCNRPPTFPPPTS